MSKPMKVNIIGHDGSLLCSATVNAGNGSMTASSNNEVQRTIETAINATSQGSVELIIDGKTHSMPITLLQAAFEAEWSTRPLPALTPFNSSRTYSGCDAATVTAVNGLGRGINLGQMWESIDKTNPKAGAYRDLKVTNEILRRVKLAGFDHVRMPCNWARQASGTSPYTLNAAMVTRYKQDIDLALANGLKVIVNQHHSHLAAAWTGWASENGGSLSAADILVRQQAIMVQVAQALSGYAATDVFLELENEPHVDAGANGSNPGWTDARWESYWPGAIAAIRAVDANRVVLLGGTNYNNTSKLAVMGAITDQKTVLMAHPYEPHTTFTHQFAGFPLWTLTQRALILNSIDIAYAQSVARGLPVVFTEFGCNFFTPRKHRAMYLRDFVNAAFGYGIPFSVWNLMGGGFDVFSLKGKFIDGLAEALTGVTPPTFYAPIPASGNILDWSMAYWGIGTSAANVATESTVSVSGDTLTFGTAGTHVAYYVPTKGVELTPGRRFRFTISGAGGGGTTKMFFQKIGPQIGSWDGVVQVPMPSPSNASSVPAYGDHGAGTYEYVVPDVYPDDKVHTESDPWCFRFQFTSMVVGATRTVIVTPVD